MLNVNFFILGANKLLTKKKVSIVVIKPVLDVPGYTDKYLYCVLQPVHTFEESEFLTHT